MVDLIGKVATMAGIAFIPLISLGLIDRYCGVSIIFLGFTVALICNWSLQLAHFGERGGIIS